MRFGGPAILIEVCTLRALEETELLVVELPKCRRDTGDPDRDPLLAT